jgi:hypothetical protein
MSKILGVTQHDVVGLKGWFHRLWETVFYDDGNEKHEEYFLRLSDLDFCVYMDKAFIKPHYEGRFLGEISARLIWDELMRRFIHREIPNCNVCPKMDEDEAYEWACDQRTARQQEERDSED